MSIIKLVCLLLIIWNSEEINPRAEEIVRQMTIKEKIQYLHGIPTKDTGYVGYIPAIERLNLPQIAYSDGPQGAGNSKKNVTLFPSVLSAVATWDRKLMKQYASAIAKEQRARGTSVHLGPMVNIARVPRGGRNFESMGEDPFLSSEMARHYIRGVQENKILANVKHFILNEQETDRHDGSSNIDERTLHEIYFPRSRQPLKKTSHR